MKSPTKRLIASMVFAAGVLVIPVLADPLVFVIALLIVKFRPQGFITQGRL